ncbi:MAG TPA: lactate racemase domain-containing protein [Desulfatiglandales bacterium]|nr:lactate racemase domain-containing protein [Desulfatiglandales bacterium]
MSNENIFHIPYGDTTLRAALPERTRVIRQNTAPLTALPDPAQAVRDALNSPIDHEPLSKLVGPKSKVTVAFDDPIGFAPAQKQPDFRSVAIKVVLEELDKLGVDPTNIRLVCAVGLHRKWTTQELGTILGEDLAYRFGPSRLYNHDAEDRENLIFLGETTRGQEVEVNRVITDSDQVIYVSNPWSHFNGGWKSAVVGLGSFRSIRHHHRPFPRASGKSTMDPKRSAFPRLLNEMGEVIEKELAKKGHRFLIVEGVMNNAFPQEVVQVVAGHPPQAHEKTLEVLQRQHVVDVKGQSDVVIYGMGNNRDPYSKMSTINPILVRNLGLSYSFGLFQNIPLVKEGGIIILVHPCLRQFDAVKHPSYVEMFEKLIPETKDPFVLWELYAEEYAHRPEFVHKYRYGFGFHGVHPLILWGQGAYGLRYVGKVFIAGAKDPEVARLLGFEAFATVEEAIAEAERLIGKDCSISYPEMRDSFICNIE